MYKLALPLAIGLFVSITAEADDCRKSADRSATVNASGVSRVVIGAGAGDLKVQGQTGSTEVQARGRACASSDEVLGQIQLESRREGDTVYLKTLIPELTGGAVLNSYAGLHLTVQVPDSAAVEIEDSSGELALSRVRSAKVEDGSGEIDIDDIAGDLDVSDSSGEIEIERVAGNLRIKDSSGEIEVEEVRGAVESPVDSSGEIRLEQVGSVHIHEDSSGGIVIRRVNGNVRIDVDSSGDIDVAEVAGNFSVGADGSGDIRHSKVLGKVELPQE